MKKLAKVCYINSTYCTSSEHFIGYIQLRRTLKIILNAAIQVIKLLLLLLLKEVGRARLGESDLHPISLKTPAPQYRPTDRKKRNGKIVEDKRDKAAQANKKALTLLMKPARPTPSNTDQQDRSTGTLRGE